MERKFKYKEDMNVQIINVKKKMIRIDWGKRA